MRGHLPSHVIRWIADTHTQPRISLVEHLKLKWTNFGAVRPNVVGRTTVDARAVAVTVVARARQCCFSSPAVGRPGRQVVCVGGKWIVAGRHARWLLTSSLVVPTTAARLTEAASPVSSTLEAVHSLCWSRWPTKGLAFAESIAIESYRTLTGETARGIEAVCVRSAIVCATFCRTFVHICTGCVW